MQAWANDLTTLNLGHCICQMDKSENVRIEKDFRFSVLCFTDEEAGAQRCE